MKEKQEMEKVELTEQGKKNVRIRLQNIELEKTEHEFNKEMSNFVIENQIPTKMLTERLSELKSLIESKKDFDGKVIPESKIIELQAELKQMELNLSYDLPMKRERNKLSEIMNKDNTMGAKEQEIKDLKKALRTGFIEVPQKEEVKETEEEKK